MALYSGNFSDYYDYYYEIESFVTWEEGDGVLNLRALNKAFIVISIIICVLDLLLLVTVLSASARERSASWYLYHLTFVTILQIAFSLPRLEFAELHSDFGSCMFFSFTEWTLNLVYCVNFVLMDVEILATILTSNSHWQSNPQKRFFISMATAWISCILFSAMAKFFGHEESIHLPICFHENKTSEIMGRVMRDWVPAFLVIILTLAGLVLFIRTKRSPDNYTHISANQSSLQSFNEWFTCFMTCNVLVLLTEVLLYAMYTYIFVVGIDGDIILQMTAFLVHIGLPLSCLLLEPVRDTYMKWMVTGFQSATGVKRASEQTDADTQMLNMEACE